MRSFQTTFLSSPLARTFRTFLSEQKIVASLVLRLSQQRPFEPARDFRAKLNK